MPKNELLALMTAMIYSGYLARGEKGGASARSLASLDAQIILRSIPADPAEPASHRDREAELRVLDSDIEKLAEQIVRLSSQPRRGLI